MQKKFCVFDSSNQDANQKSNSDFCLFPVAGGFFSAFPSLSAFFGLPLLRGWSALPGWLSAAAAPSASGPTACVAFVLGSYASTSLAFSALSRTNSATSAPACTCTGTSEHCAVPCQINSI